MGLKESESMVLQWWLWRENDPPPGWVPVFSQCCQLIESGQTRERGSHSGWVFSQHWQLIILGQTLEINSPSQGFNQPCQLMRSCETLGKDSPSRWVFNQPCQWLWSHHWQTLERGLLSGYYVFSQPQQLMGSCQTPERGLTFWMCVQPTLSVNGIIM